jgi:hypothetical protein
MVNVTLPSWFWITYYLFLLATIGTSIITITKKKMVILSVTVIFFTITVYLVSLINWIGRTKGLNEFEYLTAQLQQGSFRSILVVFGYGFLLFWWVMFIYKFRQLKRN